MMARSTLALVLEIDQWLFLKRLRGSFINKLDSISFSLIQDSNVTMSTRSNFLLATIQLPCDSCKSPFFWPSCNELTFHKHATLVTDMFKKHFPFLSIPQIQMFNLMCKLMDIVLFFYS